MPGWTLEPINAAACRLVDPQGRHVGNLKLIGAVWKFKAIGHDAQGDVIPGGGPFTGRHNLVFEHLDPGLIGARLSGP